MISKSPNIRILLIFTLAVLAVLAFRIYFSQTWSITDGWQYERIALNFMEGRGFSINAKSPFEPTLFKEPLYPLFLASVYHIFGKQNYGAVFIIQAIIHGLTVIIIYKLAELIFDKRVAFIASVLIALHPSLLDFANYLYNESLFIFTEVLSIYLLIRAMMQKGLGLYFLAGLALGVGALCRAQIIYFVILLMPFLIFSRAGMTNKRLLPISLLIVGFVLVILPWVIRNKRELNSFEITKRIGISAYRRVAVLKADRKDFLSLLIGSFSYSLSKKYSNLDTQDIYDKYGIVFLKKFLPEDGEHFGYDFSRKDDILLNLSLNLIKAHPIRYFWLFTSGLILQNSNFFVPSIASKPTYHLPYSRFDKIILLFLKLSLFACIISIIFSSVKNWQIRHKILFPIILLVVYFNLGVALILPAPRYMVVLYPFYILLAVSIFYKRENAYDRA